MEEINRSSHSDTKKPNHFTICNIILILATDGNKRRNFMQNKILY